MSKFIELTGYDDTKVYFNVDAISFFYLPEGEENTMLYISNSDEEAHSTKETPAEIMAKIQEVQG